jgi:hypothetical protein
MLDLCNSSFLARELAEAGAQDCGGQDPAGPGPVPQPGPGPEPLPGPLRGGGQPVQAGGGAGQPRLLLPSQPPQHRLPDGSAAGPEILILQL